ncbi:MAG: apolipoprotein N-acyltransferase [Gammaproteobacteria bacterium]
MKNKLSRYLQDWRGELAALLFGALVPLAFAPFDLFPLVFVSLAALFYIWQNTQRPSRVFLRGYVFGLGYFGFGISWVSISMVRFGGMSLPLSIALTALLVLFVSLYIGGAGYLAKRFFAAASPRVTLLLLFPALLVLLEWVRGWLFTGFPWIDIGYSQVLSPLSGLFPVAGVYGVSLAVAVCAGCLAVFVFESPRAVAKDGGLLIGILSVSGLLMLVPWSQPDGPPVTASLIQGNIGQEVKWLPQQRQPTIDLYTRLTRANWQSDIIIWPETALPAYLHQAKDFLTKLGAEARRHHTSVLIGLPSLEMKNGTRKYYNSAVVLNDGAMEVYRKYHLVPFGEFIPFKWLLGDLLAFMDIPMSDFSSSAVHKPVVTMGRLKGAVSICYEDAFGEEVIKGLPAANFLINISNDAWFGDSLAPHQHLQKAQARALETARPMLRATNNGISAVIDDNGNIIASAPQFTQDVLTAKFQPMQGATLYVMVGNYLVLAVCCLMLLAGFRYTKNTTQ